MSVQSATLTILPMGPLSRPPGSAAFFQFGFAQLVGAIQEFGHLRGDLLLLFEIEAAHLPADLFDDEFPHSGPLVLGRLLALGHGPERRQNQEEGVRKLLTISREVGNGAVGVVVQQQPMRIVAGRFGNLDRVVQLGFLVLGELLELVGELADSRVVVDDEGRTQVGQHLPIVLADLGLIPIARRLGSRFRRCGQVRNGIELVAVGKLGGLIGRGFEQVHRAKSGNLHAEVVQVVWRRTDVVLGPPFLVLVGSSAGSRLFGDGSGNQPQPRQSESSQ